MTNIESAIVKKLKAELKRKDEDYCQWILGAAIKKEKGRLTQGAINYTARVVMKTNESIYVDGAYFGDIRTLIPETSGQHIGIIRTAYRKHPDTLPG